VRPGFFCNGRVGDGGGQSVFTTCYGKQGPGYGGGRGRGSSGRELGVALRSRKVHWSMCGGWCAVAGAAGGRDSK
jgi:hypothetical protein